MADRATQRKVYRSVSFKKLETWGANKTRSRAGDQHHISKDLEIGALPPSAPPETAAEKAQPSATRSVTVSRKVSKISAASLSTAELKKGTPHSISPSIRQLSEKFSAKTGLTHGTAFVSTGTLKSTTLPRSRSKENESTSNFGIDGNAFQPTQCKDAEEHLSLKSHEEEKYSTQESASGSDSDRSQRHLSRNPADGSSGGKRDYSHIARYTDINHTHLNEEDVFITGAPACKSYRSYSSTHGDSKHVDSSNWPSVTKIRELFGDRKLHRSISDAEDLKSSSQHYSSSSREASYFSDRSDRQSPLLPRGVWQDSRNSDPDISESSTDPYSASLTQNVETFKTEPSFGTTTHAAYDSEFTSGVGDLPDTSKVQNPGRGGESQSEKLDSDPPRPSAPAPPPRSSSVAHPRRAHQPLACTRQQQQQLKELQQQQQQHRQGVEQPQLLDSLHSSHSSFRPQTAPSVAPSSGSSGARWRFSSGEEEYDSEGRSCTRGGGGRGGSGGGTTLPYVRSGGGASTYFSPRGKHDNNNYRAKLVGRSSGSEEDSPAALAAAHSRDNIRRRSLRKKKKSSCSRDNGESDDSDDQPMMMDQLERHQQQQQQQQQSLDSQQSAGRRFEGSRTRPCFTAWERSGSGGASPASSTTTTTMPRQEGFRRFHRGAVGPDGGASPSGTPPVPAVVSRVSKVTIPSFLTSPCGSRSSSRYSSTETLKEEDQPASASVMSKTYHGNFTMYRSPSFGHGDNFSRTPVRVVPRVVPSLSPGDAAAGPPASRVLHRSHSNSGDKERNRMSMSNPDIASETMSLLSYLKKTDLSGLKVGKKGRAAGQETGVDGVGSGFHTVSGASPVYRMGSSRSQAPHSGRPSLKDLTATLRRAQSFTYSDKTPGRRYSPSVPASRSSSEQRLDCQGDGERIVVSDREVESDDCCSGYRYEETMPSNPLHDRYVQEARKVIQDICQMGGAGEDDDFGFGGDDSKDKAKSDVETEVKKEEIEVVKVTVREDAQKKAVESRREDTHCESEKCLQKGISEENVFYDKSLDELSGHESSMTDEGIVTEPEAGPSSSCPPSGKDLLGQPLTVWSQSALYKEEVSELAKDKSVTSPMLPNVRTEYEAVTIIGSETSSCVKNANPSQADTPSTPNATRRRRKFSSAGNNGSDSSNGSNNGESNGESAYRSLSDPMPHRRRSLVEDGGNAFSVDSNLLGSLTAKGGGGGGGGRQDSSAADLSECTGSAASDLSVCSDSLRDYSAVMESIVREPGTMDKVVDEKGNGKAVKKKSFSDPSRRGEPTTMLLPDGQSQPSEPISELEQQPIPPSSSEPILSEQRGELWAPEGTSAAQRSTHPGGGRHRSQSEHALPSHLLAGEQNGEAGQPQPEHPAAGAGGPPPPCFAFDPKLAEVLSPRMSRRSPRKRPNRAPLQQQLSEDSEQLEEQGEGEAEDEPPGGEENPDLASSLSQLLPLPKARPGHVRHASEPATFVPIVPPAAHASQRQRSSAVGLSAPAPLRPPPKQGAVGDDAPSLEDVTKRYILNSSEGSTGDPPPLPPAAVPPAGTSAGGSRSTPATPTTTDPQKELSPAPLKAKPRVDMRRHVVMTLLDTEQSYVESLRTLIQGYMRPLKQPENSPLVDPSLVDEMFFQIPEILDHHEHFLEQVLSCVNDWHDKQTVGHLLTDSFSKEILANIYSAYIDNFLNAKDAVRIAKEAKPAFLKFLEQSMRENKEKQALADLMIKPVQRIPRYELLVKDLLKHTPEEHPDHQFLLDAQRNIKRLAERINKGRRSAEEVERETRVMQEIEAHIEGVEHIMNPQRKFLRQEMVMEAKTVGGKKDRSLFLFSDLLICTTLKRKSGSLRRSSMSLYTAASIIDTSSKYKFLWKLPLEDVEMVKGSNQATNRENIQKTIGRLDEDLSTLGQISKLSETLSFPHQNLDDVIKDLMASVHRELAEKQSLAFSMTFLPTKVELTTASAESTFIFEFSSPEARSNFEQAFEEAKKKLAMNKDQWDPEFLKAIPIMKTRSGMQFSCASPSHSCPENTYEVWVCNSDGYVGQVCLLNIRDEPTVEACIAVCSARIICIAAVPGLKGRERAECPTATPSAEPQTTASSTTSSSSAAQQQQQQQQQLHISISGSSLELSEPPSTAGSGVNRELVPFDSDDTDDEDSPSPSSTLQSQASHSTISSSFGNDEGAGSKDMATETTSSEEEPEFPVPSSFGPPRIISSSGDSPMDGRAMRRSSRGSFTRASLEDLLSIDPEAYQSSVWLGTEDGCIHVYQSSDNIRNRKNSMKMQHSASILCILYLDNKVFVSLANGEVIVYQREAGSFWDPQSSQTLCLGTPSGPVTKMVPVAGKLWCGCQNRVLIINTSTLVQEHSFQVGQDSSRCVTSMVSYGQGVWMALQGSAQVRLYHAATYESLTEVDVAPAVHKMLAGSDAIIRQHKAACLRITALLACKDLLWIGTSAGVVLTLAVPPVSSSTSSSSVRGPLQPMGSAHGHTGHVRFLTSIELPEGFDVNFPLQTDTGNAVQSSEGGGSSSGGSGGLQRRDSAHRRASTLLPTKNNLLVISGGDGYEDFRLTNSSETVGRDDSTNHLLLWRV
ncbi:rho guanine nucleotide exchange factor 17-like [Engraulis encrasicolus]|uniref:rho guanine nucleotide exchange factor 17-like n=1 Tax=Engraulis encrasicolus TaxID=184585 RepID=UPI002FD78A42